MTIHTQIISGKILSKVISIPSEMKDQELEITIRPIRKTKKKFSKLYSSPIVVNNIIIPSRSERNE